MGHRALRPATKLLDLSLADSLGCFHDAIPAYGSLGFTSYTDTELADQVRVSTSSPSAQLEVLRLQSSSPMRAV
ncbi:MAG: hypothetical protein ACXVBG_18105 [Isosphaeraceae bacterium]